jgi:ferredoxin
VPTVTYRGRTVACEAGAILREVLLDAGETPHGGGSRTLNCRGHGTCGTCAVAVAPASENGDGPGHERIVSDVGRREHARLSVPPHDPDSGLRLACRTRVYGDVVVEKHPGFWGQHVDGGE